MPTSPPKICAVPGCGAKTYDRYCNRHRRTPNRAKDQRESAAKRGYDYQWRFRRENYLRANPLCVDCLGRGYVVAAKVVDHIQPLNDGGADDESNYQALCVNCHNAKSAREKRKR